MISSDPRGLPELLPHRGREEEAWNQVHSPGWILGLSCPVIAINRSFQQLCPNKGKTSKDTDPSGIKILITQPDKKTNQLKC